MGSIRDDEMKSESSEQADLDSMEAREELGKMIIRLFRHWSLSVPDQLNLLGLSENSRAMLSRYERGESIPHSRDTLDRIGWLLAIHKALRLLYPQDPEFRYGWVSRRHQAFGNLRPLDVMREQGIIGMARVSRYLDTYRSH